VSIASFDVGARRVNASSARIVNGNAADLANGRRVEVEGVLSGTTLLASRVSFAIETVLPPATVSVEGTIADFVSRASFSVAGQRVDASGASFENGSPADLANGRKVHVKGALAGAVLKATTVEFEDATTLEGASAKGKVTDFVSIAKFKVAGRSIDASAARFEGGTAADLRNGKEVEVEGVLVAAVLKAAKVAFD
jgi:hypothetical protein